MIYGFWNVRCNRQKSLSFLGQFLPFHPPDNPENQYFKIEKITWRYYHFTHLYHTWQLYDVWFLRYGASWTEFFVISDHFMPFYSPNSLKNKNFEKLIKTLGDIIILKWCTKNHDHMLYCSWYMVHKRCNWYFPFWAIFCPFTSQQPEKLKFKNNNKKKDAWRYHHFTMVYQKSWSYAILFLRYCA